MRNGAVKIAYELVIPPALPSNDDASTILPELVVLTLGGISGIEASRKAATVIALRLRRRVLIWDRRNTGKSSTNFSLVHASINEEDAEDLRDLVRRVAAVSTLAEKIILIGCSSGARVSLLLTHRYPGLIRKLVLAPPTGGGRACDTLCDMYYNGKLKSKMMPYYVMKERAREAHCLPAFREAMRKSEEWLQHYRDEIVLGLTDAELRDSLARVPGGVMVVHTGDFQDALHTPETSVELVGTLGGGGPARHRLFLARDLLTSQLSSPTFVALLEEFVKDDIIVTAKL